MTPTLSQAQWLIAEALPAYRKPCTECGGSGEYTDSTLQGQVYPCPPCHGKGYLPREPWELADVLWEAGYDVDILRSHSQPKKVLNIIQCLYSPHGITLYLIQSDVKRLA